MTRTDDGTRPVSGRWFEELEVGTVVHHATRRTVTETDNVLFTTMTMNPAPLHLDADYAAGTEFGRPLVNSMFTLALVVGLSVPELTLGTIVAQLGLEEVSFPAPVFPGDTIRVETEVVSARPSRSRPDAGVVVFEHRARNQRDELVCRARRTGLMHRGPSRTGRDVSAGTSMAPPRSLLFVPGGRPDLLPKVGRAHPDAVVVDLEDAVAPEAKETARQTAIEALLAARPEAGAVLLRVNPPGTAWHDADLAAAARACASAAIDGIVLPKYERVAQLAAVRVALPEGARIVAGLETALGVADARTLLAERPDAAYFGAEDYVADLGGRRTAAGTEVLYARSAVCLAAHLSGVPALDQAVVAVHEREAFRADAEQGRCIGYRGKICLHPLQVEIAHTVFAPSPAEVEHARAVLSAAERGVGVVDGRMVDAVHVTMARGVLAAAGEGTRGLD